MTTNAASGTLSILEQAIKVELQGLSFYSRAARRTENAAGKAFFMSLVDDEKQHERILRAEYEKVKTGGPFVEASEAVKAALPELRLFPKGAGLAIPRGSTDLDVLQIAIKFEHKGHDLYLRAAEATGDLTGQAVYAYLAEWEDRHRETLQKTLNQLSADGTWLWLGNEKPLLDGA